MRKLLLLTSLVFCLTACEKNDETQVNYYVKYQAFINTQYIGNVMEVSYLDENGDWNKVDCSSKSFEVIIGPVHKGYKAQIKSRVTTTYGELSSKIHVCIGNEQFTQKATGGGSCEYVIK